jgi:hypothetical protein
VGGEAVVANVTYIAREFIRKDKEDHKNINQGSPSEARVTTRYVPHVSNSFSCYATGVQQLGVRFTH